MTRRWEMDLKELPSGKARELRHLLEGESLEGVRESLDANQCRDHFCYELVIEERGKVKMLQYTDDTLSRPLRDCLVQIIQLTGVKGNDSKTSLTNEQRKA